MRRLAGCCALMLLTAFLARTPLVAAAFTATTSTSAGWSAASSFYAAAVAADSPMLYWRLGESGGTTAVDAVGNYPGTYSGTVTLGTAGYSADGDTATTLTGAGQVRTASTALNFNGRAPFTLEAWTKITDPSGYPYGRLFSDESTDASGLQGYNVFRCPAGWSSGGYACLCFQRFENSAATGLCTAATLGAWHHLAFTYDGSSMCAYVDGSLSSCAASSTAMVNRTAGLTVGNGANPFAGTLDEVAVYDYALSAGRIQAHYARGG